MRILFNRTKKFWRAFKGILRELDEIVMSAGGRIYLTKDSRLNPEHLPEMYVDLEKWKGIKHKFDPTNQWQSDQGRRLKLC